MAHHNKFDYRIKENNSKWDAEITRRVTAHKTTVSKRKKGFETQELAEQWAKEKLTEFLANLQAGNKRKAEKRTLRNELAAEAEAKKEAAATLYIEKRQAALEEDSLDEE